MTYERIGNFPSGAGMEKIMARLAEERKTAEQVRNHKWSLKTNRQKAEALIAKVDPYFVRESDLPVLALAQVHATLAIKD